MRVGTMCGDGEESEEEEAHAEGGGTVRRDRFQETMRRERGASMTENLIAELG